MMPRFQARPLIHPVLPTLPVETSIRYEQLNHDLATRLAEQEPQRLSDDTLSRLLQPATARWPDHYVYWSMQQRRITEVPAPRLPSDHAWSGDLSETVRAACGTLS
jgi:hypothetical protein